MTAPVFMDSVGEAGSDKDPLMSFVLPAKYTLDNAPKPTNEAVTLQEINEYQVAVIRFNGRLSDSNIDKHRKILEAWIYQQNFEITGAYKRAGYNAPFTLPALRRNEVLIPVKLP